MRRTSCYFRPLVATRVCLADDSEACWFVALGLRGKLELWPHLKMSLNSNNSALAAERRRSPSLHTLEGELCGACAAGGERAFNWRPDAASGLVGRELRRLRLRASLTIGECINSRLGLDRVGRAANQLGVCASIAARVRCVMQIGRAGQLRIAWALCADIVPLCMRSAPIEMELAPSETVARV